MTKHDRIYMSVGRTRLMALADHLRNGELGHEQFDFSCYNLEGKGECAESIDCGTNGCAMGELPIIFPEYWRFRYNSVILLENPRLNHLRAAEAFFGLVPASSEYEIWDTDYGALFIPKSKRIPWAPTMLDYHAGKEEVADGIETYVRWRDAQIAED